MVIRRKSYKPKKDLLGAMAAGGQAKPTFNTSLDHVSLDGYGAVESPTNGEIRDQVTFTSNGSMAAKQESDAETIRSESSVTHEAEPSMVLFLQVLFPFLIAGFGMVLAGIVLDIVQHWPLFKEVPETFILVPALLGLKGNLEMTLASRLSTQQFSVDGIKPNDTILKGFFAGWWCNYCVATLGLPYRLHYMPILTKMEVFMKPLAIVVTFLASGAAIILSWIPRGEIDWGHAALLCASSLATASLASFLLSGVMIVVIILSRRFSINPDNVATPIAASLGDLTTLAVLSVFGSIFLAAHQTESWLNTFVIVLFLLSIPFWVTAARREHSTEQLLRHGWSPIVFSMFISSSGGFVLERAMRSFTQMALFQPVINGVGGNLAAVHASRISTFFHKTSEMGVLPYNWQMPQFYNFKRAFFSSDWDARSARVLLFLVVPGHILFNWMIGLMHTGENPPSSALFTSIYLLAALAQVTILLFVCQWLVALMWQWRIDPDNAAIPYLTALGDLVGTTFLFWPSPSFPP